MMFVAMGMLPDSLCSSSNVQRLCPFFEYRFYLQVGDTEETMSFSLVWKHLLLHCLALLIALLNVPCKKNKIKIIIKKES